MLTSAEVAAYPAGMSSRARSTCTITVEQVATTWLATYRSTNTRDAYRRDLDAFTMWCNARGLAPLSCSPRQLVAYREAKATAGASPATVNRHLSSLRAFFDAAVEMGATATHPLPRRAAVAIAPSETTALSIEAARRLLSASRVEPRTAVLVHLLLRDGLRLAEALGLDHAHVDGPARAKVVTVRRHGHEHRITLSPDSSAAVVALQRTRGHTGPLLTGGTSDRARKRITRFGADHLIKGAARAAGLDDVSANVLRHTHAALAQRAGDDDEEIRVRMGHRDVRTTRRYLTTPPDPTPTPTPTTP